ncbi:MAG: bacillithiol biosynthesis deacetylase BshB1 [Planctomycetota bacterium]
MSECAALFLGPHPDDVEIAASGTILKLTRSGQSVVIADLTAGEMGSRGTGEQRQGEARAAATMLGVSERRNLAMRDTAIAADDASVQQVVALIRELRPRLLFAPHERDVHPDHTEAGRLAGKAWFLAGLVRYAPELGAPHRPRLLVRYAGNVPVEPTFAVDIAAFVDQKAAVLGCYRSQLVDAADKGHLVQGFDIRERAQLRDRFYGARIGCAAAEPFVLDGPLPLTDLAALLG